MIASQFQFSCRLNKAVKRSEARSKGVGQHTHTRPLHTNYICTHTDAIQMEREGETKKRRDTCVYPYIYKYVHVHKLPIYMYIMHTYTQEEKYIARERQRYIALHIYRYACLTLCVHVIMATYRK